MKDSFRLHFEVIMKSETRRKVQRMLRRFSLTLFNQYSDCTSAAILRTARDVALSEGIACRTTVTTHYDRADAVRASLGSLYAGSTNCPDAVHLVDAHKAVTLHGCRGCGLGGRWRAPLYVTAQGARVKKPFLESGSEVHLVREDIAHEIMGATSDRDAFRPVPTRDGKKTHWMQPIPGMCMPPLSPKSPGVRYWDRDVCECGRRPWFPASDEQCRPMYSKEAMSAAQRHAAVVMFEPVARDTQHFILRRDGHRMLCVPSLLYSHKALQVLARYTDPDAEMLGKRTAITPVFPEVSKR